MGKEEEGQDQVKSSDVRSALEGAGGSGGDGGYRQDASAGGGSSPGDEDAGFARRDIRIFGVNNLDRAVFCRQLATMIEVGIPLLRSLQLLSKRTAHQKLSAAIGRVAQKVEQGQSVSKAMDDDMRVFSPLVCNIVRVGEVGGILENSLVRLAEIMESKTQISRKIFAAMMYPLVALVVAFGVVMVILVKAVPVFTEVYTKAGAELPGPTQIVMALSNAATNFWPLWVLVVIGLVVGLPAYFRTLPGRTMLSFITLRFPVLGRIARKIAMARFSRTLSSLLSAGIPLTECLEISAATNENTLVAAALRRVHDAVQSGEKVGPALARTRIFEPLVVDMISIGEETGTLDRMLERIADIYDADVDATLSGVSAIIEPVLIVFLGGIVIFIALAVMLPYFNLSDVV